MTTRLLLTASSVILAAFGLLFCFASDEVMAWQRWSVDAALSLLLQTSGGLALGLALLDWMSKGMRIGGIYGRPLVMANLLVFSVAGLSLVKALVRAEIPVQAWAVAVVCIAAAALYGRLLFVMPKNETRS